jgi:hypothetical protein
VSKRREWDDPRSVVRTGWCERGALCFTVVHTGCKPAGAVGFFFFCIMDNSWVDVMDR